MLFPKKLIKEAKKVATEIRRKEFTLPKNLKQKVWRSKQLHGICLEIYISPCKRFILKCNYIDGRGGKGMKYRIPTQVMRVGNSTWRIQPMAKTDKKSRALAYKELRNKERDLPDFHNRNVGIYNHEAVLLDW